MTGRRRCVVAAAIGVLAFGLGIMASPAAAYVEWQTFRDDDGTMESNWGWSGSSSEVLRKTFVLEKTAGAQDAIIHYEIGANPYHYARKTYFDRPTEGVAWNDMVILVNGAVAARGSPMELGVKGWHKVRFDPKLLKKGENHIDFTWASGGTEAGRGGFYLGIDTDTHKNRSSSSVTGGTTFTFATLHPERPGDPQWQGEYMVRLQVAFGGDAAAEPAAWKEVFSDDFNRSDVFGPDWAVKNGKWDVRPGNLRANGPDAVMMCTRRLQTPFRIEYMAYSDNPCDLSIELRKKLDDPAICFVDFGAENNTLNKIQLPVEGPIAVGRENLIEVGRKHKVTVEVGDEGTVRQIVDGKETVKAAIRVFPKQLYFGFYVWTQGVFDTVKVFSPHAAGEEAAATKSTGAPEKIPVVRLFRSFDDCPAGEIADSTIKVESGEKCSVKIADVPTWEYFYRHSRPKIYKAENRDPSIPEPPPNKADNKGEHFVTDPCLELRDENGAEGQRARVTFPVPEMKKGFIEFDLMADHYEGDGFRIMLGNKAGLWFNKDGDYRWRTQTQTIQLMDHVSLYSSVRGMAHLYLQPQRWFTVRIEFDLDSSLANVALVEMFNGVKCAQTEYLVVGEDLPLPLDAIQQVAFETCGPGRFFVDNLFMISRTEDLAGDEKWHAPAREMMKAYYPLRKDPIHLKEWSMRHINFMEGSGTPAGDEVLFGELPKYPVILACAEKYNRIMVRQALLAEKMKGLERAWVYAAKTAGAEYQGKMVAARQAAAKAEALLDDLYQFYAACYLDRLNQDKLKEGFEPRHAALAVALDTAEATIQNTLEEMRADVVKRSGCRFAPYAIEPVNTPSMKLKFSDGAFRRPDGKRDFLFVKMFYYMWPSMEEILTFSPTSPVGVDDAVIKGAREPEYCNSATNSWFYRCMTLRPDEQIALRINSGEHNHESSLPEWWFEKHKSDPDIFLQNSKGESYVSRSQIFKQYNYWNPDVLAAQKATLDALGDLVMKSGNGDRVSYIDLAQEAYYLISAPGGAWETGYNKSAVKAFQAGLKEKYGTVQALNERWGSKYANFEEIRPPEDWRLKPERVPGLTYEFERFRQDSWHSWMKQCRSWLRDKLGRDIPSSCQITYNGNSCVDGLDWTKLFETFNIVMEHYYQQFEEEPLLHRYLENLREAFKSTTGIGEWYVSGLGDIFDEEGIRNNGLRQACQQAQWGRAVLVYWQGHDFMFLHNGNATENRLGHTLLRYHSAYIPISIARAEAHRAIYLECPLVQPDVGLLGSESSFYNVGGGGNSAGVGFASMLFRRSHDYGNLTEQLILEGRQSLKNYKMVVLGAPCLQDAFVDKLVAWVKDGGILLATGPVGVMNELGVADGKFPDAVLGAGQWRYEKGKLSVKEGANVRALTRDSSRQPLLVEASCGQGKVYFCLSTMKEDAVYDLITRYAPRKFYEKDGRFHLAMRDGASQAGGEKGSLYLSALNPDCYKTFEDEIVLQGEYREIADISNNFPIIPEIKDGKTSFKLRLGPAEAVMIRIRP